MAAVMASTPTGNWNTLVGGGQASIFRLGTTDNIAFGTDLGFSEIDDGGVPYDTTMRVYTGTWTEATSVKRVDGVQVGTFDADSTPLTLLRVGDGSPPLTICEWAVYDRVLTTDELDALDGYLMDKWLAPDAFIVTNRGTNTTPGETPVSTINVGPFTPTANSLVLGFEMAELDGTSSEIPIPTRMSFTLINHGTTSEGLASGVKHAGLWRAPAGATPSATTVTFDPTLGSDLAWHVGRLRRHRRPQRSGTDRPVQVQLRHCWKRIALGVVEHGSGGGQPRRRLLRHDRVARHHGDGRTHNRRQVDDRRPGHLARCVGPASDRLADL